MGPGFQGVFGKRGKKQVWAKLSQNTKASYFNKLKAAFKQARIDGIIKENPAEVVKGFKEAETDKAFLTADELKTLAKADCKDVSSLQFFLYFCTSAGFIFGCEQVPWDSLKFTVNLKFLNPLFNKIHCSCSGCCYRLHGFFIVFGFYQSQMLTGRGI